MADEYINRDAAIKAYIVLLNRPGNIFTTDITDALLSVPAADVRPVVLCKDCLHYEMGACLKIYDDGAANKDAWQERKPDDFCSYGEKREES